MGANQLSTAYTRIFIVESVYWIVSIGMVFVNEDVLNSDMFSKDLTILITVFQILFSLSILVTLNHLTKIIKKPTKATNRKLSVLEAIDHVSHSESLNLINEEEQMAVEEKSDFNNGCDIKQDNLKAAIENAQLEETNQDQNGITSLIYINIPHRIKFETCKQVFPLSILYIGMLLMNNFCLKNVGVEFYFVSRSLTTVFNVIFTRFLMNQSVCRGALICCTLIIFGFLLGVDQESLVGSFSLMGVVYGVVSSLFGSLFSIYTKKTLDKLNKNIWVLILYNNMNAIIICIPLLFIHGDFSALMSDKIVNPSFWFLLSVSGVISFLISIVTNASIKYTSPLTHNISGTAKACFQTVIAVIYNQDSKSILWWISNFIILISSAAYSRIRQLEMERASRRTQYNNNLPNLTTFLDSSKQKMKPDDENHISRLNESSGTEKECRVSLW